MCPEQDTKSLMADAEIIDLYPRRFCNRKVGRNVGCGRNRGGIGSGIRIQSDLMVRSRLELNMKSPSAFH